MGATLVADGIANGNWDCNNSNVNDFYDASMNVAAIWLVWKVR